MNDDLNKRVTERIQEQLVAILPEEDIRKRVDMVIDSYFSRSQGKESEFDKMVKKHLDERVSKLLSSIFYSPEWQVSVDENLRVHIGAALQTVLKLDPDALKDTTARIIALQQARDFMFAITCGLRGSPTIAGTEISNLLIKATEDYIRNNGGA